MLTTSSYKIPRELFHCGHLCIVFINPCVFDTCLFVSHVCLSKLSYTIKLPRKWRITKKFTLLGFIYKLMLLFCYVCLWYCFLQCNWTIHCDRMLTVIKLRASNNQDNEHKNELRDKILQMYKIFVSYIYISF